MTNGFSRPIERAAALGVAGLVSIALCALTPIRGWADDGNGDALERTSSLKRAGCTPFGNPPRPRNDALTDSTNAAVTCVGGGYRLPNWTDPNGTHRAACLYDPGTATPQHPLPLLVYVEGSMEALDSQLPRLNVLQALSTADLTGDPSRPGFILLAPVGRVTDHFYPPPDDTNTLGWDVWYRQFGPPLRVVDGALYPLNADFATLDHYIAAQVATGRVDTRRIYLLGQSNGASLALVYGQNRPSVAALALYAAPSPYDALSDPCGQKPVTGPPRDDTELQIVNPSIPAFHIHNACDIFGICPNCLELRDELAASHTAQLRDQIITGYLTLPTDACVDACGTDPRGDPDNLAALIFGGLEHGRWPSAWLDVWFAFLRDHPLHG